MTMTRWRLVAMLTVTEMTARAQVIDIVEGLLQRVRDVPQLELAHARRVDEQAALRQQDQLTMTRRMTAA